MISALLKPLDDAYHLAVNVLVLAITPVIEDMCELTFGAPEEGAP